ncbi:hypothetical protein [Lysinibacillus xylanilyticus]|uniref:hypothetical protein n=1 Tax=Lysinibacillus xylanilyticus TaxID=582475 RepID=UPI0036DD7368
MTENGQENKLESDELDEEQEEYEERREQGEEDYEEDSSDHKIVREYKKRKSAAKKIKTTVKNKLLAKVQVLIAVGILLLIVMWDKVEDVLHWVAGQEEITVVEKSTNRGCFEITTQKQESYCVDEGSYNLATKGNQYLIEEYQYSYKLRAVK